MLDVGAEDYMTTGKFNGRHPGEAISLADVANYAPVVRHKFPDSGYFVFHIISSAFMASSARPHADARAH